ncbi:mucin-13 isoform X2 [Cyanistes caeruleus]|uniref:mucin-13 isoform X2 n=1 Tax=Cyanistes caeruleus TaxID=156563 RepID=UPI000CDB7CDE|nr:mucin-13 isoform X2 [Cyanistes caeruleus]
MRRSVLLALWLGLVLSLLKEASTVNGTTPHPKELPTPKTTANASTVNGTTPGSTVMPTTETNANASTVNGTTPGSTVMPTTETNVDFCSEHPCGINFATCISLKSKYTCQCRYGFYYSDKNCYKGQVYPATIAVRALYTSSLHNVNSTEYEKLFDNVSAFFRGALQHNATGYMQTNIIEIQDARESRNSVLNVTVTNLFTWDTTENATTINDIIQHAIENGNMSYVYSYEVAEHCSVYKCDNRTTDCHGSMFPECKCKPGLAKTIWDDRSCSVCSESCSAASYKYCVREEGVPKCKCMANYKNMTGDCVACPVGYAGEDCSDNSELILIIVGTVLGAVVLILVIAVSIVSVRAKHKQNPEKKSLINPGYTNKNTSDERPSLFPRVQTTSGHTNPGYQPNNPYDMRSTNRDNFPERDYDNLYEASQEPRGFRRKY